MDTIKKIEGRAAFDALIDQNDLDVSLSHFPWGSEPMTVRAKVCHDGASFFVAMRCFEKNPRATVTEHEGDVHFDSCMEFFFSPCPGLRPDYFNMEANPNGAMKFNYGAGRHGRIKTHNLPASAAMRATVTPDYWQLVYEIPFSLIQKFAPEFTGLRIGYPREHVPLRRIGGGDILCHVIPSRTEKPDYHRPEYFQPMTIE